MDCAEAALLLPQSLPRPRRPGRNGPFRPSSTVTLWSACWRSTVTTMAHCHCYQQNLKRLHNLKRTQPRAAPLSSMASPAVIVMRQACMRPTPRWLLAPSTSTCILPFFETVSVTRPMQGPMQVYAVVQYHMLGLRLWCAALARACPSYEHMGCDRNNQREKGAPCKAQYSPCEAQYCYKQASNCILPA